MTRVTGLLIALAVVAIIAFNAFFVVDEREQAIVLRFGEIQDVKTEPGLYVKAPLGMFGFDNVQIVEDRRLRLDIDNIRVQVSGGKFYEVDAFVLYHIADARRFRSAVGGDVEQAEARLRTRLDSALRGAYGVRGFEAALSEERISMMREVRDQLRPDASQLGLEIEDVRIRRTDLTREVSDQTYERMKAERLAEAELIRARGREAASRMKAIADRQVVETLAEAQRESEILRGEGDAERNRLFADAFSRDPEFFEFYRSMLAYTAALENSGTTMVLSPDSEFFRYFNGPTKGGGQSVAPAARPVPAPSAATAPQGDAVGGAAQAAPATGAATGSATGGGADAGTTTVPSNATATPAPAASTPAPATATTAPATGAASAPQPAAPTPAGSTATVTPAEPAAPVR